MNPRRRYVLLVDDDEHILSALKRELGDWSKERYLEIMTTTSAKEGLEMLQRCGSDTVIVLSDLRMPEMKGSDFLLEVSTRHPAIVSVLLTGYSDTCEIAKSVKAGIFSYMVKPWESDYLITEITKAYEYGELKREGESYLKTIEEELRWAGELQKAILRPNLPRCEGMEFRVSYRPVPGLYCGGDYYDVVCLGEDRYLLLVGDVEGHGVKAAFVTGILKAIIYPEYISGRIRKAFSPGDFLDWLDERMSPELKRGDMAITFFAGVIDLRAYIFLYANADHCHPFIIHDDKPSELLVTGSAIGSGEHKKHTERSVRIGKGDIIDIFTDGLVEAARSQGTPPVKLENVLNRIKYGDDYHRNILEAALAVAGSKDFADAVTILTARIL